MASTSRGTEPTKAVCPACRFPEDQHQDACMLHPRIREQAVEAAARAVGQRLSWFPGTDRSREIAVTAIEAFEKGLKEARGV